MREALTQEEMTKHQDFKYITMKKRRIFLKNALLAGIAVTANGLPASCRSTEKGNKTFNIGIIGLDTSHSPAFAKYINDPEKESMAGMQVTAAYPYGSERIESSAKRIPEYTEQFRSMGIAVLEDMDELIRQSDGILLETNDGTMHLEQAMRVIEAKKPLFIDKPVAARLPDVIRIYEAAEKNKVPLFSSSSLRYLAKAQEVRHNNLIGEVTGASTYSPEELEPSHSDLYWYGIHGVEILYTLMGTGCQRLKRITTDTTDLVIGEWEDGRLGTFRGDLKKRQQYGGLAYGTEGVIEVGPFDGYGPLIEKIAVFFQTGKAPVPPEETVELYTYMEAADVSKRNNGDWVELKDVYEQASAHN